MSAVLEQQFGIFISRGGMPPGTPLSLEAAKKSISEGQLRRDHPAWCRGMTDWKPLEQVIEYVEKKTAAKLPALGTVKSAVQGEAAKPAAGIWKKPANMVKPLPEKAPEFIKPPPPKRESEQAQKTVITSTPSPPPLPESKRVVHLRKPIFSTEAHNGFEQVPAASVSPPTASWPARKTKAGQISAEEMGGELWTFAKQLTREFRAALEERFKDTGVVIREDLDFNFSQELLVFHLWLIAKIVDNQPRAVEAMNRKYVHRQSEVAESYEHHWQQVEYIRAVKETFALRMETYQNAWNFHSPKAQTIAAACLLKNVFASSVPCKKPVENFLITTINSYMSKLPRTIASFVEQFEVVA